MLYLYHKCTNVGLCKEKYTWFVSFLIIIALVCIIPNNSKADGRPYRVKDIGSVAWLTQTGDTIYFWGDTDNGTGVWTSDGTAAGTNEIYHIYDPFRYTLVNGKVFFVADSNWDANRELWITDGSTNGTTQVAVINPVCQCMSMLGLKSFKNMLFFQGYDGDHGWELWRSDGTPEGTVMVKDIHPQDEYNQGSYAAPDFEYNDHLYFGADDGTHGLELWVSDGTAAGTYIFTDINPGDEESHSAPSNFINFGDKFLFSATTDSAGKELWVSRGLINNNSNDGTELVKDIFPGTTDGEVNSSSPDNLVNFNGKVYFIAATSYNPDDSSLPQYELWSTDGTEDGTVKVYAHPDWYGWNKPDHLTVVNDKLFFTAGDLEHQVEVWISDGSTSGTHLLKDIFPGRKDGFWHFPYGLTAVGDLLYFGADDGQTGVELWKSDGTENGTVLVENFAPGSDSSYPDEFTVTPSHLFFRVNSMELWAIDRNVTQPSPGNAPWNLFLPAILSRHK